MARGGAASSSGPATTPTAATAASAGGAAAGSTSLSSPPGPSQGPSSAKTRASAELAGRWGNRERKEGPNAASRVPARGGARGTTQWKAKGSAPSSQQQQQQQPTAAAAVGSAPRPPPAASLSDPRVASHLSLVRDMRMAFPSDDVRSASPRTASMVESVHPVLECYNYSKQDVLQLVRRLEHREDLIHSEVARVIEESTGHEQGSWKMVGGNKKQQNQQTQAQQTQQQPANRQVRGYRQMRDGRGFEGRRQQQRGPGGRSNSARRQNGEQELNKQQRQQQGAV